MTQNRTDITLEELLRELGEDEPLPPPPINEHEEHIKPIEQAYEDLNIQNQLEDLIHAPTITKPSPINEEDLEVLTILYNKTHTRSGQALRKLIQHNIHHIPETLTPDRMTERILRNIR